jgi:NAD(P)H-flavin reductase
MLRNHLDALALIHPRFKLSIVVDEADAAWDGPSGPVTKGLLASVLPPPTGAGSTAVLVAGPEPFQRAITGSPAAAGGPELSGTLGDMKYAADQVHSI